MGGSHAWILKWPRAMPRGVGATVKHEAALTYVEGHGRVLKVHEIRVVLEKHLSVWICQGSIMIASNEEFVRMRLGAEPG